MLYINNLSQNLAVKSKREIRSPQRMNPNDFFD